MKTVIGFGIGVGVTLATLSFASIPTYREGQRIKRDAATKMGVAEEHVRVVRTWMVDVTPRGHRVDVPAEGAARCQLSGMT